jgi:hypothetical protein
LLNNLISKYDFKKEKTSENNNDLEEYILKIITLLNKYANLINF